MDSMARRSVLLLLALSLLCQATLMGGGTWSTAPGRNAFHALLHWQGSAHHHHHERHGHSPGDGGFHQDGTPDSFQHVVLDGSQHCIGLIPCWPARLPDPSGAWSQMPDKAELPPPYLERFKPPPKNLV